jgi:hypothetical protein
MTVGIPLGRLAVFPASLCEDYRIGEKGALDYSSQRADKGQRISRHGDQQGFSSRHFFQESLRSR